MEIIVQFAHVISLQYTWNSYVSIENIEEERVYFKGTETLEWTLKNKYFYWHAEHVFIGTLEKSTLPEII